MTLFTRPGLRLKTFTQTHTHTTNQQKLVQSVLFTVRSLYTGNGRIFRRGLKSCENLYIKRKKIYIYQILDLFE